MAFAPDGLVEGFYDPDAYNPEEGKFIMGLQFRPERMRHPDADEFDYSGCPSAYQIARDMYVSGCDEKTQLKEPELEAGAEFLESNTGISTEQEKRLERMDSSVRNASSFLERLKMNEERERIARNIMRKMSVEQLSDLVSFYHLMEKISSEVLEKKLQDLVIIS